MKALFMLTASVALMAANVTPSDARHNTRPTLNRNALTPSYTDPSFEMSQEPRDSSCFSGIPEMFGCSTSNGG